MPSLRERKDDIPLLVKSFLREFNLENEKNITGFDAKSKAAILKYDWPGNIRELRNCVECAVVMCNGEEITLEVHHKDGNKLNNRRSNLVVVTKSQHYKIHNT